MQNNTRQFLILKLYNTDLLVALSFLEIDTNITQYLQLIKFKIQIITHNVVFNTYRKQNNKPTLNDKVETNEVFHER